MHCVLENNTFNVSKNFIGVIRGDILANKANTEMPTFNFQNA